MAEPGSNVDATFRFLEPGEGAVLSEAITAAYGGSYDVRWAYDAEEVSARLAAGTYVSCVAETLEGELLCHEGMSLAAAGDAVGHSGQAVTMAAARGQHLFTRTKRFLMDWAAERGLAGMYSEATAAHPSASGPIWSWARTRPASCWGGSRPLFQTMRRATAGEGGSRRRSSTPS